MNDNLYYYYYYYSCRYVVDPGFVKQKTYNAERRMESLVVVPISRVAGGWWLS